MKTLAEIPKINIPLSKSLLQRGLLANLLSLGKVDVVAMSNADDVKVYTGIKQVFNNFLNDKKAVFFVGESGFWARALMGALPVFGKSFEIDGKGSLLKRDFSKTKDALGKLGINVNLKDDKYLPAKMSGQIREATYKIDASFSSQHVSGLIFGLTLLNDDTELILQNPVSIPYIKMTIDVLRKTGIDIEFNGVDTVKIFGNQKFSKVKLSIESDWSGAAFFVVYGLIKENIILKNIVYPSLQGDADRCIALLNYTGADYNFINSNLYINKGHLLPLKIDLTDNPDLFPPFVVYSMFADGVSELVGVSRLFNKESNRAEALINEFNKLGVNITLDRNKMLIQGGQKIKDNVSVDSHRDHRIAMALAMAAKIAGVKVDIKNKDSVKKSFPNFFEELSKLK